MFYERPKRPDGTRGAGCVACTATEAHGLTMERVRDLFAHFAERIDGRVVFRSKRKLIDGLLAAKLASGVSQAEEIVTAIRRDFCAPESAGWRGADRPIRTSSGPRDAVVFAWVADLEEPVHNA